MTNLELFNQLNKKLHNKLYLVGGSTRDYLLFNKFDDIDLVSEYEPNEILNILNITKYDAFAFKFGTIKTKIDGFKVEITSLRQEANYKDHRHPNNIKFIRSKRIDSKRRDFSINALYMNNSNKIYDYHHGLKDLKNKIIKMIGNPSKRIQEDPLRIIRALRFKNDLSFNLDNRLEKAIIDNILLINLLSKEKIIQELSKVKNIVNFNNDLIKYNLKEIIYNKLDTNNK